MFISRWTSRTFSQAEKLYSHKCTVFTSVCILTARAWNFCTLPCLRFVFFFVVHNFLYSKYLFEQVLYVIQRHCWLCLWLLLQLSWDLGTTLKLVDVVSKNCCNSSVVQMQPNCETGWILAVFCLTDQTIVSKIGIVPTVEVLGNHGFGNTLHNYETGFASNLRWIAFS